MVVVLTCAEGAPRGGIPLNLIFLFKFRVGRVTAKAFFFFVGVEIKIFLI